MVCLVRVLNSRIVGEGGTKLVRGCVEENDFRGVGFGLLEKAPKPDSIIALRSTLLLSRL